MNKYRVMGWAGCGLAAMTTLTVWATPTWNSSDAIILHVNSQGMEPIAIRNQAGIYRQAPMPEKEEPAMTAMVNTFFRPGTVFPIYDSGTPQGNLTVQAFSTLGCFGFGFVSGKVNAPKDTFKDGQNSRIMAFSPNFPGARVFTGLQPTTPALEKQALTLSQSVYAKHGIKPNEIKHLKRDDWQAIILNQGKTPGFVIESHIDVQPTQSREGQCHTHHLLMVAEQHGQTFVPRLELYQAPTEETCSRYTFLGLFQAGPEEHLAVEGLGYESNWYQIFRRSAQGQYPQLFNGGGGGC